MASKGVRNINNAQVQLLIKRTKGTRLTLSCCCAFPKLHPDRQSLCHYGPLRGLGHKGAYITATNFCIKSLQKSEGNNDKILNGFGEYEITETMCEDMKC